MYLEKKTKLDTKLWKKTWFSFKYIIYEIQLNKESLNKNHPIKGFLAYVDFNLVKGFHQQDPQSLKMTAFV